MKISRKRKQARLRIYGPSPEPVCPRCHTPGSHFVPPCLGEPGFFICP